MEKGLAAQVSKLKRDILELKSGANTTGDSATAYEMSIELGAFPSSSDSYYLWDFYFEPQANVSNAIFMPEVRMGYWVFYDSYLDEYSISAGRSSFYCSQDIENPNHVSVAMTWYDRDIFTLVGTTTLTMTSNVPFILKSSSKSTVAVESLNLI